MHEIVATISSKNQITLPADVRRRLGVGAADKIAFVLEADGVRITPARVTLADLYGSVPALPGESADLEREIDEAMAAEADRITGRSSRP
jgi:AbrB family looped-hinge helix DNA binding protein